MRVYWWLGCPTHPSPSNPAHCRDKATLERLLLLAIENGCEGFGLL